MVALDYPTLERVKTYRWTVDVEYDFGGRTNGIEGLIHGVQYITNAFKKYNIKALFFISTETLGKWPPFIKDIRDGGHEIGSHGHYHTAYKNRRLSEADKEMSIKIIASYESISKENVRYRAPKFNYKVSGELYSYRKSHVSLLKHMWLKEKIKKKTIIYLHPFDIVETNELAPNLFCKLWYSRPKRAYDTFINLLNRYPHSYIDEE